MSYKIKLDKKQIGQRLYELIEKSEYTRENIAELLNLTSPRVIYDWTNGIKLPCLENFVSLAQLFNVHIEDILVI